MSTLLVVLLTVVSAKSVTVIAVIMLWGGVSFAIYPVGLALLGQRFVGGDIARANTAFSMLYILGGLVGRPLTGAAMDAIGDPGLGMTLAVFYAIAAVAALLVIGLGAPEGVVELYQQAAVLGVGLGRPIQPDAGDMTLVEGLVLDELGSVGIDGLVRPGHACTLQLTPGMSRGGGDLADVP